MSINFGANLSVVRNSPFEPDGHPAGTIQTGPGMMPEFAQLMLQRTADGRVKSIQGTGQQLQPPDSFGDTLALAKGAGSPIAYPGAADGPVVAAWQKLPDADAGSVLRLMVLGAGVAKEPSPTAPSGDDLTDFPDADVPLDRPDGHTPSGDDLTDFPVADVPLDRPDGHTPSGDDLTDLPVADVPLDRPDGHTPSGDDLTDFPDADVPPDRPVAHIPSGDDLTDFPHAHIPSGDDLTDVPLDRPDANILSGDDLTDIADPDGIARAAADGTVDRDLDLRIRTAQAQDPADLLQTLGQYGAKAFDRPTALLDLMRLLSA